MKDVRLSRQTELLVIDDEPVTLKRLERLLGQEGYLVTTADNGTDAVSYIRNRVFDVVLTDLLIDTVTGFDILDLVNENTPETEVIILTGYASIDSAVEATKKGAFHYLQKPLRPDEVRHIVRQAVSKIKMRARLRELETRIESKNHYAAIIGSAPGMVEIKQLIRQIESSDANVLITGESGTGKELIARTIHNTGPKRNGRFIAFNCASFSEDLIANELFGHEKDAYTGATKSRPGLIETAHNGTVFFDEIGDMPLSMQAKILRVIQERELIRVGGTQPIPVNIRIIAATNKDLKELCAGGLFRQDLYFRLKVIHIHLPYLSERREDIPLLAAHFLKKCAGRLEKEITGFTNDAMHLLKNYSYPGNIRELENIVEHAVSMARGQLIRVDNLPTDLSDFDVFTCHSELSAIKTLEEMEADYIRWVLDHVGQKKTEAARLLGINRTSLYRKLKRQEPDEQE